VPAGKTRPRVRPKSGEADRAAGLVEVELVPLSPEEPRSAFSKLAASLGRRDFLMMAIGAACLLVLELVGFLVGYLLLRKKDDSSDDSLDGAEG
jgi:hypothetical protein